MREGLTIHAMRLPSALTRRAGLTTRMMARKSSLKFSHCSCVRYLGRKKRSEAARGGRFSHKHSETNPGPRRMAVNVA